MSVQIYVFTYIYMYVEKNVELFISAYLQMDRGDPVSVDAVRYSLLTIAHPVVTFVWSTT